MSTDSSFDLVEHFNNIPTDPTKSKLFAVLYRIEGICQQNWNTMPGEVQSSIIDLVQEALAVVRHLPDGLPE